MDKSVCGKKTAVWRVIRVGCLPDVVDVEVPSCLTEEDELFHILEEWVRQRYTNDDTGETEYAVFSGFKVA